MPNNNEIAGSNRTSASSFVVYAGEFEPGNSDRQWEALARNCSHDGLSIGEAAKSGAALLSQFAILLVGPISLGSLIVLFAGGTNSGRFAAASDDTEGTRDVVTVPDILVIPRGAIDDQDTVASAFTLDLVPRLRRMAVPASPAKDENASRTDAHLVEEIVVVVPPRKPDYESGPRPNPPTSVTAE